MKKDIILIGPVGVGKSTIGELLSKNLKIPQASLDNERWEVYKEIGYDFEHADKLFEEEGFLGIYDYWKKFEAYSVERVLDMYQGYIHDFGAGQSVYEDEDLFERVRSVLDEYQNIVLLMPCTNKEKSLQILFDRNEFEHNNLFINNTSNEKLAKITVYTEGKTPTETCDEIIEQLKLD